MDGGTAVASGSGAAFVLALVNAWLASHRDRSALGWFLASLILAPISLLFTVYLFMQPRVPRTDERAISFAAGVLWLLVFVLLLGAFLLGGAATGTGR